MVRPWHPLALAVLLGGCTTPSRAEPPSNQAERDASVELTSASAAQPVTKSVVEPVRTVDLPIEGDRPALVVRGARTHRTQMLFLPGMCVHPGGYVMAFQHTAAARGDLVSLQGDVSCGGDGSMRMWSYDLDAMNRRIDAAFRAAGLGEPKDVIVIGYSQGAERGEKLVARWPKKYSAAILMASPVMPSPSLLAKADAVALMAGTRDAQTNSRDAVKPLRRAGVPAAFFSIPGARHGQMGETPEATMTEALDFIEAERARKRADAGAP